MNLNVVEQRFSRAVSACEICGGTQFENISPPTPNSNRVMLCTECGLFFANPTMPLQDLEEFYDEEFTGDPGAREAVGAGKRIDPNAVKKARTRLLPTVMRFLPDLRGRRVLDLRSRTGGLAQALTEQHASVVATDPMPANVERCRNSGLDARLLGIHEHATLPGFDPESFDVITGLTFHLLGHLPEPSKFLARAYEILRPGGYLFLDEKNILSPARTRSDSLFDTGIGHFFHFTPATARNLVQACGFDVISVDMDRNRKTAFRHFVIIARRPVAQLQKWSPPPLDIGQLRSELESATKAARKITRKGRLLSIAEKVTRIFSVGERRP